MRDSENRLRSLDPAAFPGAREGAEVRRAALERILATPREGATNGEGAGFRKETAAGRETAPRKGAAPGKEGRRSRRLAFAGMVTASVVVAAAMGYQVLGGATAPPAHAATPPPLELREPREPGRPAAGVLEELARRVERLPGEPGRGGAPEHFVQETWSLSTRIDGVRVTSAVVPERRETWKRPDGSLAWRARTQPPRFATPEQRRTWEDSGAVGRRSSERGGTAGADGGDGPPPGDTEGMRRWLGADAPGGTAPGRLLETLSERHVDHRFGPAQRAAVLRVLASVEGVVHRGGTRDRGGRAGEAFSVESDGGGLPERVTLVFHPEDGRLLAYEEELTEDPGALGVRIPAVVMYVTYLKTG
ncbi:hypothetical protein JNUCC64_16805 [Streptomyces sp. JNUCC 64]